MNIPETLIWAVVLIAASISLGLLAYAALIYLRDEKKPPPDAVEEEGSPESSPEEAVVANGIPPFVEGQEKPLRPVTEVAVLHRDRRTKQLIVRIGSKEYSSAAGLKQSEDLPALRDAALELFRMVRDAEASPDNTDIDARSHQPPPSMIEQINEILRQRAGEAGGILRSVYLAESSDGSAKVFIGLNSYSIEDIPNAEVQRVISEAVRDWEAQQ